MCGRLDASARVQFKADASRRRLKEVMKTNGLIDVWRENNPRGFFKASSGERST